jgi:hypothetical protein
MPRRGKIVNGSVVSSNLSLYGNLDSTIGDAETSLWCNLRNLWIKLQKKLDNRTTY